MDHRGPDDCPDPTSPVGPDYASETPSSGRKSSSKGFHAAPSRLSGSSFKDPTGQDAKFSHMRRSQRIILEALDTALAEVLISLINVWNFALICLETDRRADMPGRGRLEGSPDIEAMIAVCFVLFVLEFALRVYAEGRRFFRVTTNCIDTAVVALGAMEYFLKAAALESGSIGVIRVVRLCRMARLLRVVRVVGFMKELRRLLQMMTACLRTLFWSASLLLTAMTIWAIIAVEFINGYVQELSAEGVWDECSRCARAYASTFQADVTLFQTVVAGDSWGQMAIPVIEKHPWTAIFFAGSLMTLIFGILNLVVAVIVDTFAEQRENDMGARAAEMDKREQQDKQVLTRIFEKIDEDKSGALSLEELQEGANRIAEFRHWLRVLDIDQRDLEQLFSLIDEDESGEIDAMEFVEAMYRMRNTESRSATMLVKHMVMNVGKDTKTFKAEVCDNIRELHEKIDRSSRIGRSSQGSGRRTPRQRGDGPCEEHGILATGHGEGGKGGGAPEAVGHEPSPVLSHAASEIEEVMQHMLSKQDRKIQAAVEAAVSKASQVAFEAALQAAANTANDVMTTAASTSSAVARGLHQRMFVQRQVSPGGQARVHDDSVASAAELLEDATLAALAPALARAGRKVARTAGLPRRHFRR